jgi:thymidylate synthase (FAD)
VTETVQILDHGYLKFVEHWGSDQRVIEAARMSTDKGFLGWGCWKCDRCGAELERQQHHTSAPGVWCGTDPISGAYKAEVEPLPGFTRIPRDEKLLKYLYENKHATPFEMAGMTVIIQAPILVFREHHRHRTQSYNEMSARYVPLPDLNYIPSVERLMLGSDGKNKQAGTIKDAAVLTEQAAHDFRAQLQLVYDASQNLYEQALKSGVPKELARVHLPVGRYSRMMASANLRNWLAFLTLRMDEKAQWEIRQYANAIGGYVEKCFPRTWELFVEGRKLEEYRKQFQFPDVSQT